MLVLTVAKGPDRGKVFELRGVSRVVIGRNSQDLKLNDIMISRYHAKLKRDGDRWLVRDLGSRNGTKLNGERLVKVAILKTGDHIVTGYTEFEVSYVPDASDAVAIQESGTETDDDALVDVPVSAQQGTQQEEAAAASHDDGQPLISEPPEPASPVAMSENDSATSDIAEEADIAEPIAQTKATDEAADDLIIEQMGEVETDEPAQNIEIEAEPSVLVNESGDDEAVVESAEDAPLSALAATNDLDSKMIEAEKPVEAEAQTDSVEHDLEQEQIALASDQIKSELEEELRVDQVLSEIVADEPADDVENQVELVLPGKPVLSEQGMLNLAPMADELDDDRQENPISAQPSSSPERQPPLSERAASEWMSAIESQLVVVEGQGWDEMVDEEDDGFIDALEDDMEPLENHERSLLYFDEDDHWAEDVQPDDDALVNSLEEDGPEALLRDLQIKPGNSVMENPVSKTANGTRKGKKKQR